MLEIINTTMKKNIALIVLTLLVIISVAMWFGNSANFNLQETGILGGIIIVLVFALFVGYKRFLSAKRGEPSEDEYSKTVMQKTSSLSYYLSLYMWLGIMYFSETTAMATSTLIGIGILGMSILFAVSWAYFHFKGIQ